MSIKVSGFDELQKDLERMAKAAKKLHGTHQVPFNELFTHSFMTKYTKYQTFDELLDDSGFVVETNDDFAAIPDDLFDAHISKNTTFNSWNDMMEQATSDYIAKKLGF